MDSISERVAAFLRKAPARGHCFRCLAASLDTAETELHRIAELLMTVGEFRVINAQCYRCRRADTLLTFNPFAHPLCTLCRRPMPPTAPKTILRGLAYHAACWDRKARSAGGSGPT